MASAKINSSFSIENDNFVDVFKKSFSYNAYADIDIPQLHYLFKFIYERKSLCYFRLPCKLIMEELGIIFRKRQLWLQSKVLVQISDKIGFDFSFPNDVASIDTFIHEAKTSGLLTTISNVLLNDDIHDDGFRELVRLLLQQKDIKCANEIEKPALICKEIAVLFRMQQLWLQSNFLKSFEVAIPINKSYATYNEALSIFYECAKRTSLMRFINVWYAR